MIYRLERTDCKPLDEQLGTLYHSEPQIGDVLIGERKGRYTVEGREHLFPDSPYSQECHVIVFKLSTLREPDPKPAPVPHKSFFSFARMMRCL